MNTVGRGSVREIRRDVRTLDEQELARISGRALRRLATIRPPAAFVLPGVTLVAGLDGISELIDAADREIAVWNSRLTRIFLSTGRKRRWARYHLSNEDFPRVVSGVFAVYGVELDRRRMLGILRERRPEDTSQGSD